MNERDWRVRNHWQLVSARMKGMRPIYSTKKIQWLICINFLPKKKQKVNKNLAQMTKKNFNQTSKWCIYGWFALNFLLPFSQYKFIKSATKIFTRWQNENGMVSFHTCTFKNLVTAMTFWPKKIKLWLSCKQSCGQGRFICIMG